MKRYKRFIERVDDWQGRPADKPTLLERYAAHGWELFAILPSGVAGSHVYVMSKDKEVASS